MDSAYLLFRGSEPKVYGNEKALEKNPDAVDRDDWKVFPSVAHNRKPVPSVKEAVPEREDVWNARELLRALPFYNPCKS